MLLKKQEHKDGPPASQGMLDAIDTASAGSVYVIVLPEGVKVNPGDIIVADEDGVAVVPRAKAAEVLKKAQQLDDTEHRMYPFIVHREVQEHPRGGGRSLVEFEPTPSGGLFVPNDPPGTRI